MSHDLAEEAAMNAERRRPEYVDVEIAVAVAPNGDWSARGDALLSMRDSMESALRGATDYARPAHVYILKVKLRLPGVRQPKPKVVEVES